MHLNNLVIIPIPALYTPNHQQTQFISLSPFKLPHKLPAMNNKDDISWKKSFSAFKKFKPKRDKQAKLNNPSILATTTCQSQQYNSHQLLLQQKSFSLVNNEMDFSLLDNMEESKITSQLQQYDKLNYYDPNVAPFFQYGVSYKYLQKENRVFRIEGEGMDVMQDITWGQLKKADSLKQSKQYTRKDNNINNNKSKSQSYFKLTLNDDHHNHHQQQPKRISVIEPIVDNAIMQRICYITEQPFNTKQLKSQKPYCSQGLLPQYRQKHNNDDPFIIIKSTQRRQFTFSNESINTSRRGDTMKSRQIKKTIRSSNNYNNYNNNNLSSSLKPSNTSSIYSRSVYSDRKESSYSSQGSNNDNDDNISHDYGNNQLQMIQFDLINHINPHNELDNLPIFQLKDQSEKKNYLIDNNNYYNNDKEQIIKEYQFKMEGQNKFK